MGLGIVQSAARCFNDTPAPTFSFFAGPTEGNLMICLHWSWTNTPAGQNGWTLVSSTSTAQGYCSAFYKYAGPSELAAQAPSTASGEYWGMVAWEIAGVIGTWVDDFIAVTLFPWETGASYDASVTTSQNNEFLLIMGGGYAASDLVAWASSVGTQDVQAVGTTGDYLGNWDAIVGAHVEEPTSGTVVSTTISGSETPPYTNAIILELANPNVAAATASVTETSVFTLTTGAAVGSGVSEISLFTLVYLTPCTTQRADLWKITRADGVILGFTGFDHDLTWEGQLYKSCGSLSDSAVDQSSEMGAVGNVTLTGIINSDDITDADLYAGKYDDAYVEGWTISWGADFDPATPYRNFAGWMGQVSRKQANYEAEVLGPGARLAQAALISFFTPGCRWDFGVNDGKTTFCPVNVPSLSLAGITVTGSIQRYAVFFTASEPSGGSYWDGGQVTWTSGANNGTKCTVDVVDWTSGVLSLWDLAPYPPAIGDTFTLSPGCPKTKTVCMLYDAYVSFGGFPDVPGPDALQQNADSLFTGPNG